MLQRLLNPDRSITYGGQNATYYGAGSGSVNVTKDAPVKDFYFMQKFSPKSFETKDYDSKGYWSGDFVFATKPANVKTDDTVDKTFGTKAHEVKQAREATQNFATTNTTFATFTSGLKGKTSQNHLDETYKGQTQMNIDEVRDLLNKPKLQ